MVSSFPTWFGGDFIDLITRAVGDVSACLVGLPTRIGIFDKANNAACPLGGNMG